jgi:VIT1/CCC1 family predicted Fe2+/Mn2+ transporter
MSETPSGAPRSQEIDARRDSSSTRTEKTSAFIFGMTDGLAMAIGLILGLVVAKQSASALWHSALAGGLAEIGGMSLGQYWSDEQSGKQDWRVALVNGLGSCVSAVIAGSPFAFLSGVPAFTLSVILIVLLGAIICWLRPEKGFKAFGRTYVLLLVAGALGAVSGIH